MSNGANSIHKQLRRELEDYIKSQYFGKSPILLSALSNHIDDEGLLYQKPFIESSPAYVTVPNGIETASIEPWMKNYFLQLAEASIGVFKSPFAHQSVLCGRFLQKWLPKQEASRNHGQNEVFVQLLCIL